ncbi:MAG: hypothetical protein OXC69_02095 [Candidatus Tectomicrobia bacterium]|nr:hypothetical protein [Candidatus Tectomicrobia bacterium]
MTDFGTTVSLVDESALTKGQLRKLNALRKSVGPDIGERAFAEWLASQGKGEGADKNIETIVDALWTLVQEGKLQIRRGGYLVRRGRGRLIVEPGEAASAAGIVRDGIEGSGIQEGDPQDQRELPRQDVADREDQAQPKHQTWRGLSLGGGRAG